MSKKRDRRQHKRRRQAQTARADERRDQRRAGEERFRRLQEALGGLETAAHDPAVTPEAFAAQVGDFMADGDWGAFLTDFEAVADIGRELGEGLDGKRAAELGAGLAAADGDAGRHLAWWAYGVADGIGDEPLLEEAVQRMLAAGDPPGAAVGVMAERWSLQGRPADALDLLEERCRLDPGDDDLQAARAGAFGRLRRGREGSPPLDRCPLSDDQMQRAGVSAARFADPAPFDELWAAVQAFVAADDELARWQAEEVARTLEDVPDDVEARLRPAPISATVRTAAGDGPGPQALRITAIERSWLSRPDADELDEGADLPEEETVLGRFAAGSTDPLAADARAWLTHVRYGLWQVADPDTVGDDPEQAVWVTDLVTRQTTFVTVPSDLAGGLPRWAVLAGPLVPLRGVWRPAAGTFVLDPAAGDRAAEVALEVTEQVFDVLTRERRAGHLPEAHRLVPHGVLVHHLPPMAAEQAAVAGGVLSNLLPALVAQSSTEPAPGGAESLLRGPGTFRTEAAEAEWRARWIDQPVPGLSGATPREAAASYDLDQVAGLEALLHRFEFDAGRARATNLRPMDVDRLRTTLDFSEDSLADLLSETES